MFVRRNRRSFRPTFEGLPLRLAPSGITPTPMDETYVDPTGPISEITPAEADNGDYLEPTGPSTTC